MKNSGTKHETQFNDYFQSEGLKVIGYRDVPVDVNAVAPHVASTMPHIQQVFIDILETPAKPLYMARKQMRAICRTTRFRALFHKFIA